MRQFAWLLAIALALGVSAVPTAAIAAPGWGSTQLTIESIILGDQLTSIGSGNDNQIAGLGAH